MEKKVTYKEPESYFNKDMMKAAREWEKAHKGGKEAAKKVKTSARQGKSNQTKDR